MTYVSNDPSWWPQINRNLLLSYLADAVGIVVVYDWVLTLEQEIELTWRQRWYLMTVLYLIIRYIGIPFSVYVSRSTTLYCANSSSLTISVHLLRMSHMRCVSFF
ncbi:uncharacterized protein HD556DRAFT_1382155 [Suillus plorans]|uniref:DUF6533 domain-containing protein n=1 Tax=Suillus plorans TaxID=116603 RepID=A0A9P7DGN8_9AGAM|nr:uncharacterized protein HD556DRAFT_1382155 [Suillus plorans]KAG1791995.1 hypothetical protein HD556DRAFT_1382155 [Suillus plorans]